MTVGLVSLAQSQTASKSKIQLGANFDETMMKNFLCAAGAMQSSATNFPAFLNATNLPKGTLPATVFTTFSVPTQVAQSTLVLAWKGTIANSGSAGLELNMGGPGVANVVATTGTAISTGFSLQVYGTDGYIEFNYSGTPVTTNLSFFNGATFTNLTSLIVCRKTDYALVSNPGSPGDLIRDDWIAYYKSLTPRTLRHLGLFGINNDCNLTQFRYRADWRNGIACQGGNWIPSVWSGDTSGTNTYTVAANTDTPAVYTDGEVVQLRFVNAASSASTLNVNGKGAVNLYNQYGSSLAAASITANMVATCIYDALLQAFLVFPNTGSGSSLVNIPLEIQVWLCNRVGTNGWFQFPAHITTANSTMEPVNSVTQMTQYVSNNLVFGGNFEYANEIWNFTFPTTSWAGNVGKTLGFPDDNNRNIYGTYAYKLSVVAPLVKAAWASAQKCQVVCAFQGFGPTGLTGATNKYRLQGADIGPKTMTVTGISSSSSTPTVTVSGTHDFSQGNTYAQAVVLASVAGAMGTLVNGVTLYAFNVTATALQLSTSPTSFVPFNTNSATYTSGGSIKSLYSAQGNQDFSAFPNRPVDASEILSYATYYSGVQCQNFDANYTDLSKFNFKVITGISSSAGGGVISYASDPGYITGTRIQPSSINQTGTPTLSGMNISLKKLTATTYQMYTDQSLATPVDTSAFAYVSGGITQQYSNIAGLVAWADQYALGDTVNQAAAIALLDADIAGSSAGETTSGLNANIYPAWETVAASYDGARPSGKANLGIELYEGAFESFYPSTATCAILGYSTAYSAKIATLLDGYKKSQTFYNRVKTQQDQFFASNATGRTLVSVWFIVSPFGVWAMVTGSNIYSSTFKSFNAIQDRYGT